MTASSSSNSVFNNLLQYHFRFGLISSDLCNEIIVFWTLFLLTYCLMRLQLDYPEPDVLVLWNPKPAFLSFTPAKLHCGVTPDLHCCKQEAFSSSIFYLFIVKTRVVWFPNAAGYRQGFELAAVLCHFSVASFLAGRGHFLGVYCMVNFKKVDTLWVCLFFLKLASLKNLTS